MTKFIVPLFALALLLAGCTKNLPFIGGGESSSVAPVTGPFGFDGSILSGKHTVVLKTSLGNVTIELDANAAPKTVTNFITLAKSGYYDGLVFHRVIPNFMIQGGDPNGNGSGGVSVFGPEFEDEMNAKSYGLDQHTLGEIAGGRPLTGELEGMEDVTIEQYYTEKLGYKYNDALPSIPMKRGVIAMANRGPGTNGSQFFVTQVDTQYLEGKHTVFGKVTDGMDVVDAITRVERNEDDMPLEPVTITGVDIVK
jgi:cyclophilin family peptidyl-prolyl cis-trans isomerase